jgi:hypothetical protein
VPQGEQVPNAEKIYSIFETHTDLIKRGKVLTPVEFGHKVFLAESAQGLITQYEVLEGNPGDDQQVEPSLERHKENFGRAPELYSSDRGFFSETNVKSWNGVRLSPEDLCRSSSPRRGSRKRSGRYSQPSKRTGSCSHLSHQIARFDPRNLDFGGDSVHLYGPVFAVWRKNFGFRHEETRQTIRKANHGVGRNGNQETPITT